MKAYQQGWTLRRRVGALLGVLVVLLLGLAGAEAAVAAQNRQNIDAVLLKTGPLRVQAQELMSALLDQETSVRGYAVNGDRGDLAPYEEGVRREQALVASIRDLSEDYPDVRRTLEQVEQLTAQWRSQVAEPVIATTGSRGPEAGQALITDQTRQRFEGIRSSVETLQDEILTVREETAERVNSTSNALVILLIVAALVVTVAGVVMLLSLDRILIRPLAGLVEQVRVVAAGDYRHHIEGSGPPEFRRLADDIDQMRMKIAQELDEVRQARERIEWVNTQLQKQAEELTRSNRDLEQFAYVASHDLQEPLRKVASFCQLLQRRYAGQLDERADQYIAFAVDGAQRMQRLINDLLAFSRIGRLTTGFTEVDLNKVMGDVAGQTEAALQYADAELTWDSLPAIRGEEPLLTNLLVNLVSNSVKFRRPDVPPKVHVSARLVDDEWEISCRDNGIGIEPEFADKIFVIFQRLHSKDAYPGTGIGLAIVKKIVEYHGGRVWVDTDGEVGTTIRFTLPALEADIEAARQPLAAGETRAGDQAQDGDQPAEAGSDTGQVETAGGGQADVASHPEGAASQEAPAQADGHGTNGGMKETVG
ncbi:sensor histidine kinase [Micromonospora sp. DT31]|uniref:sensor histidine kinase n=1 Tax=Micromonospora sp. DT31 TaxID=3393434 RepID=UPI003CF1A457